MATSTFAQPAAGGSALSGQQGVLLTRHRAGRYAAALCGVAATALFFQPWVTASLNGIGATSLSGAQLARGEAQTRVDAVLFAPGARSADPATAAAVGASGGLTLPTRVPTVAAVTQGVTQGAAQSPAQSAAPSTVQSAGVPGGLTLPTRVPTVAAGSQGGTQAVAQQAAGEAPAAATSPAAAPTAEPATLPQFSLYFLLAAALGLAVFPLVWERQATPRDRRFGVLWTLVVSYGGAVWVGSLLRLIVTAPAANALIGPGVGGVTAAEPALWGTFAAFALGAGCLTLAWLSPPPVPHAQHGRGPRTAP